MSEQTTNTGKLGTWTAGILALAAVVSFGLATLLEFWRGDTQSEALETVIAERVDRLAQLEEGMAKEVNSYRWVKKAEGVVQLPIDVAMKATLKELQEAKPGPSGVPVDLAAAAPAPAPEASSEPTEGEKAEKAEKATEEPEAGTAPEPAPAKPDGEAPKSPAPETAAEEAAA